LEKLSEFSLHLLSGFFVGELVLTHYILEIEISRHEVSGWHDVVVVNSLHEWLDLGSSLDFLLAHSLGYLQWVPINTSHQSVSEFLVLNMGYMSSKPYLLSVIVLSHNDSFLSSMSSSKKNDNSSRFHTKDIWLLVYSQE
jgi:hypothetical protein